MTTAISHNRQAGFTLVELLIVAIILAILAAIVVPQFANTATGAGESALRTNLAGIRSSVELYRQQFFQQLDVREPDMPLVRAESDTPRVGDVMTTSPQPSPWMSPLAIARCSRPATSS